MLSSRIVETDGARTEEDVMRSAIMIRVTPEDHEQWIKEHNGCEAARRDYGMTDGPVYRDVADPKSVLVQLDCEDLERAKGWFSDPRFRAAVERAGKVSRLVYFAQARV
jgi:hypothetical protein